MNSVKEKSISLIKNLPYWLKQEIPDKNRVSELKKLIFESNLNTVCQSAKCPNIGKCWGCGVATFMILGNVCTRACRFCAVHTGKPVKVDANEPEKVALAVKKLNLSYAVITSVTRDDLKDLGCGQFVNTIKKIKEFSPETKIEILIPDFQNRMELIEKIKESKPNVVAHNIEMIERLYASIRPNSNYHLSLEVLKNLKKVSNGYLIKSGFMVGLGETFDEIKELMSQLLLAGCQMLTIGQYLSPCNSQRHVKESRFVEPEEFKQYKYLGLSMGFKSVLSAPLVRSSFIAEQGYMNATSSKKLSYGY